MTATPPFALRLAAALFAALCAFSAVFPDLPIPLISFLMAALRLVDFALHEFGHLLFTWAGTFIYMLGGTIGQLALPSAAWISAARKKQWIAAAFLLVWLGQSLFTISTYMADARSMSLELFSPFAFGGGEIIHDWNYLLGRLGLLPLDHVLAALVYVIGLLLMLSGVMLCLMPPAAWLALFQPKGRPNAAPPHP